MEIQRPTTARHQSPVLEQPPTPESIRTGSALSAEAATPGDSSLRPLRPRFGPWRCSTHRNQNPVRDPPCSIGTRLTPQRCDCHPPSWEPGHQSSHRALLQTRRISSCRPPKACHSTGCYAPRRFIDDNVLGKLYVGVTSPSRDGKRHVQRAVGAPIEIRSGESTG